MLVGCRGGRAKAGTDRHSGRGLRGGPYRRKAALNDLRRGTQRAAEREQIHGARTSRIDDDNCIRGGIDGNVDRRSPSGKGGRSEERRVGKEDRYGWAGYQQKKRSRKE